MNGLAKRLAVLSVAGGLGFVGASAAWAADTARQDKAFVADSGEGSVAEIEMAKLALKNSQNAQVRAFATKMIHDHTMLIQQMKPFADRMGVPAPTVDGLPRAEKDEYQRLSGKTGKAFDLDYIQTMDDDHHKDLADFTKERDTTANPELKATVAKGTEVIKMHTEMIDTLAKKDGLKIPAGM